MNEMRIDSNKPFMAEQEYRYIQSLIKLEGFKTALEWGSGASTVWFPDNCPSIESWVAIEHDLPYYDYVKVRVSPKVDLRLIQEPEKYINVDGKYDFILIDGVYRDKCLEHAFELLSDHKHSQIILHDSGRKEYHDWYDKYAYKTIFEGEGRMGQYWDHRGLAAFGNVE